jgi:hypothetical protein
VADSSEACGRYSKAITILPPSHKDTKKKLPKRKSNKLCDLVTLWLIPNRVYTVPNSHEVVNLTANGRISVEFWQGIQ